MIFDVRYSHHPDDVRLYDTEELREQFLIERVFVKDDIALTYSHQDRMVAGGAFPVTKELDLCAPKELAADYFLQRRELGMINVGGAGYLIVDGKRIEMAPRDGMYLGLGVKEIKFGSVDPKKPAKFYMASSPAHKTYPNVHIPFTKTNPRPVGNEKQMNKRVINQYLHPIVLQTCQLQMGLTELSEGSSWNTMPCHTHERRMEVYFYFDLHDDNVVFHMMGEPNETRHIVVKNEELVISPSWSIHSGIGTSNYTFIWAMCGENQEFDDMDHIKTTDLK